MKVQDILSRGLWIVVLVAVLSACGGAATPAAVMPPSPAPVGLTITDVWARAAGGAMNMPTPTASADMGGMDMAKPTSAVYMKITGGGMADKLIQAESTVAETVELHTVEMKDGVMKMRPVEGGIDVPANGSVELKPGGFHIMLIGLKQELRAGEKFDVKLTFEKAGVKQVTVEIRSVQQ
ncbi:MAG: copper chaperone PCu(A)C [Chloroflexi bacterium]|nr:copper chaperone PCu(A)C [Chloroflexota bacterium]